IVQGGVKNGDKAWLERAAMLGRRSGPNWVVPRQARIGDEVVIYIRGFGFFATAKIAASPRSRPDWPNRYGAALTDVRLIEPSVPLETIRRRLPALTWAKYPRSITTPSLVLAK